MNRIKNIAARSEWIKRTYGRWHPDARKRDRWIRDEYTAFLTRNQKYIMLSIARFAHINRPISGYYFEFGSHEANTMRLAWDTFSYLFDWDYVSFDSFEGLPELDPIDQQPIFEPGKLKTSEADFIQMCTRHGIPPNRLSTVKGFYDETLTEDLKKQFTKPAAVVYIDCDLYASTIPVLDFVKDFLQRGTIIVFDDWNCFHGDPNKGERRAFREFCEKHPDLVFEEFVETNEAKSFIHLGDRREVEADP